ncbi:MAG: hypothetical protein ACHP9Y_01000 [Gammaproteobacteria bacterium]
MTAIREISKKCPVYKSISTNSTLMPECECPEGFKGVSIQRETLDRTTSLCDDYQYWLIMISGSIGGYINLYSRFYKSCFPTDYTIEPDMESTALEGISIFLSAGTFVLLEKVICGNIGDHHQERSEIIYECLAINSTNEFYDA